MADKLIDRLDTTKENLENLINMSECGMMILRMQAEPEIIYANDYFYKDLQYTREEYHERFGNVAMAAIVPEEKQKIKALIARQSVFGGTLQLEFRAYRKDGSIIWVSLAARKMADRAGEQGQALYYCSCLDISRSKQLLQDALRSKKDLDLIANNIPGGVIKLRMSDFKLLYANDGFYRLAGYSRIEYSMNFQDSCDRVIHPDDAERVYATVQAALDNRGLLGMEYRIIAKNGETRWSYVNGTRVDDDQGAPVYLCVIVDITARKLCEEELADNNHRSELVTRMLKETIWTYDVQKHTLQRSGDLENTYSPEEFLKDAFYEDSVREYVHPEDVERFLKTYEGWITNTGENRSLFRVRTEKGDYQKMEICTVSESIDGKTPNKIYGITRMVSDQEPLTASGGQIAAAGLSGEEAIEPGKSQWDGRLLKMERYAQTNERDDITGLLPYADFLKRAEQMLAARSDEDKYAIVCADINEFQQFSHHYGFSISNHILKIFSDVLLANLAKDGMCARVDGDYFIVLFQYNSHKELLKAMSAVVREQAKVGDRENCLKFGSTIGIYLVQKEDRELFVMLEKADLARRSIKGLVGNHYAIYTEDLLQNQFHEENIISDIRKSMRDKTLEIRYIPRFQGDKENIIGCKAIARIPLENGQYLDYQQMTHLVERGGKLEELGLYMLREIAASLAAWRIRGNRTVPVSVNMTASQLSVTGIINRIEEIVVKENKLNPSDFIFEIPERYFSDGTMAFELAVKALSERGYRIVVSRFGADHTAVHTLRRLPVYGIKFHGEYFADRMVSSRDTIILQKIVEMARELGMSVACGGIQTKLQEEFARKIGCDIFEGDMYYGAVRSNVLEKCFLS